MMKTPDKYTLSARIYRNRLLHLHMFAMKLYGSVFFDDQRKLWFHNARGIFFMVTFTLFNVTQYIDLMDVFGDFDKMTINLTDSFVMTSSALRMILFYLNRTRWLRLLRRVDDDTTRTWNHGTVRDKEILDRHVRYSNRITAVYWTISLSTGFLMTAVSLLRQLIPFDEKMAELQPLMFRAWLPFDLCGYKFYIGYIIQLYFTALGAIVIPGWNSLMVSMMVYAIIELEQLNWKLSEPDVQLASEDINRGRTTVSTSQSNNATLVECVKKHIRVIKYIIELTELITCFVFVDFLIVSIVICTLLFQADRTEMGMQFITFLVYLFDMVAMLWIYYWHANEISLWSDRLSVSLYNNDWYRKDARYKKLVNIILSCTQKPIEMRIVFLDLNLRSFITILRAAYSYYNILSRMDQT